VRLGAHLANLPCIAFGCPSCQVALPCPWSPNLGQAVLKNLPRSQNWFLSILQLIFLPSAPLCGRFRYGSSCVWAPILPTCLALLLVHPSCQLFALPLVTQPWLGRIKKSTSKTKIGSYPSSSSSFFLVLPCVVVFVTTLRAFGRPYYKLTFHCVWVPILPNHLVLCSGTHLVTTIRAFGHPSFQLALHYVRETILLRLFVRLGAHLTNLICIAFGHPSFQVALPFPWSPNLG
jgi:hypothetical protein